MMNSKKIKKAFELLDEANGKFQSSDIEGVDDEGSDIVYVIHNIIENAIDDINDALEYAGK
jgi:hypothetical protein